MTFLSDGAFPDEGPAGGGGDESRRVQRPIAVARSEQRLAALRLALVQEKRKLHEASAREQGIREGVVGRAVWDLLEQGRLERSVAALIRDEVRARLTPAQAAAFRNKAFE
jgi:hypothetical protein